MVEVRQTNAFREWLADLRDLRAKQRIVRLQSGLIGDERGSAIIILVCGGDKRSQGRDIARAKSLAKEL
jgi:putative component of toxin-antitoxin plasmid stabilization module